MNRQQRNFNDEQFLRCGKAYLSQAFPNPLRIDCPPASKMIRLTNIPTDPPRSLGRRITPLFLVRISRIEKFAAFSPTLQPHWLVSR
jgi:hypothetical protein